MDENITIEPEQAQVIMELEDYLGKSIPQKKKISWNTFGIKIADGEVLGLGLHNRRLKGLPESIGNLNSLVTLNLAANNFKSIPAYIGNLTNLRILYLHYNSELTTLPETIGNLKSLEEFYAFDCNLTSIPESIGNLKLLKKIQLDYNKIEFLPDSIGNLKSLRVLEIGANKLKNLPESIINLEHLETLQILNNPINKKKNQDEKTKKLLTQLRNKGVKKRTGNKGWLYVFVLGNVIILIITLIINIIVAFS